MALQRGLQSKVEAKATGDEMAGALVEALAHAEMPDLKAIICAFMRRSGGADGIAKMLMREYRQAKPGTMIRSMILQMILQGSKVISAKEQSRDESMISDADLDKEVQTILKNIPVRTSPGARDDDARTGTS